MSKVREVDIVVVGAGTAGLSAFNEITGCGVEALLIDRGPLGTTCARVGCMPSKAVLHAGEQWSAMRGIDEGKLCAEAGSPRSLWRDARRTRDALARGAAERTVKTAGDRLLMGSARFKDDRTLLVDGTEVRARAFVIATGSHPVVPKGLESLGERLLTTDTLFELDSMPRSLGVLGMGAIGLEMGLAMSRLGLRVVGGDLQGSLGGIADPAIQQRALELFGSELTLWLGHPIDANLDEGGKLVRMESNGRKDHVEALLAALGRRPNVEELELGNAGVHLDDKRQPLLDPKTLRADGAAAVFIAGDVSPDRPLMHEAVDEGVFAARSAMACISRQPVPVRQRRAPVSIIFSNPDVAAVGTSYVELDLEKSVIGQAEGSANGRSKILHAGRNLVNVYVERATRRVIGASLVASRGEHLAHHLAWAVQRGDTVDELLAMPYYHPSIEEMLQSAFKDAARQMR